MDNLNVSDQQLPEPELSVKQQEEILNTLDKVDQTIEALCDWIQGELKHVGYIEIPQVTEMTNALASLVAARAQCNES